MITVSIVSKDEFRNIFARAVYVLDATLKKWLSYNKTCGVVLFSYFPYLNDNVHLTYIIFQKNRCFKP